MLDDRSYMRSSPHESRWSATYILLIVNAAIFVIKSVLEFYSRFPDHYFALSTQGLAHGYLWSLVTYQFLHAPLAYGGLWHLLCNLLVIYFFGRSVEETLGTRSFLKLYFASGIVGGLLQMVFAAAIPVYFGGSVVGASAAAFGLVAAFAAMFPDRSLTLLLFFFIPVSMRARTLLWISIALAVFGILVPIDRVANAAHLGGIIAGLVYVKWFVRNSGWPFSWATFRPVARRRKELVNAASVKHSPWQRATPAIADDMPADEFISREVDPILDKISAHGIQSLTERERRILEAARAKMAKR